MRHCHHRHEPARSLRDQKVQLRMKAEYNIGISNAQEKNRFCDSRSEMERESFCLTFWTAIDLSRMLISMRCATAGETLECARFKFDFISARVVSNP